jgi:hypothetical protein
LEGITIGKQMAIVADSEWLLSHIDEYTTRVRSENHPDPFVMYAANCPRFGRSIE